MSQTNNKPLVGVISDLQMIAPHAFHTAGDKYLRALSQAADVVPVIIPSLLSDLDVDQWLSRLDGIFLTGSYSMVDPAHYQQTKVDKPYNYDPQRDETSFSVIHAAMQQNIPLLGVCRGLQDINVALGGSLHQAVQEVSGLDDHREDKHATLAAQYDVAHPVNLAANGRLRAIFGSEQVQVNSLHSQGIDTLGEGLVVEATAPDGLVEAFAVAAMDFGLAVQWHPEWQVTENPIQKQLFEAFGEACRARQSKEK